MHTVKVIGAGFALLGLLLFLAPRLSLSRANPIGFATRLFIPLWFAAALLNLAIGVSRAGYTVAQEAPIFLIVFGVPAVAALLMFWAFGRRAS
ncbi:hypothetical protein [Bosea lathyri]|uniref:Transmembrane protein n=1 Tax=Bosea lathyri TaxID=1036778 RepID=A0A1H5ZHJ8_9HYPH|nr:hypothetical protein [Bosea lathyri]SEG35590.1 hypothetical protein SAMN04488115_104433 [Bosea lathyri]